MSVYRGLLFDSVLSLRASFQKSTGCEPQFHKVMDVKYILEEWKHTNRLSGLPLCDRRKENEELATCEKTQSLFCAAYGNRCALECWLAALVRLGTGSKTAGLN